MKGVTVTGLLNEMLDYLLCNGVNMHVILSNDS